MALYYISFGHLIICSLHSSSSPFYPILSKIKNKKRLLPFLVPSGTLTIQKYKWSKKLPHWQTTFAPEHLLLTPVPMLSAHTWYIWYIILHSLQNPLSCLQMSVWVDKIGWWNNLLSWFTNSLQDLLWFREQHFVYLYICTLKIYLNCEINTNYTSYIVNV